jgi:uncharacterized integral membrane protein
MKFSTLLLLVPVALVATALALANRGSVTFALVPFVEGAGLKLAMPLFLLVFSSFFLGVLVGGTVMAWRGFKIARRKRLAAREPSP